MDDKPNLDPVAVASFIAGSLVNPKLAAILGPYSIIFLASVLGAAARLGNRAPSKDGERMMNPFLFFFLAILVSLIATVPVANLLSSTNDKIEAQWLFAPASGMLAFLADRIPELFKVAYSAFKGVLKDTITKWVSKDTKEQP